MSKHFGLMSFLNSLSHQAHGLLLAGAASFSLAACGPSLAWGQQDELPAPGGVALPADVEKKLEEQANAGAAQRGNGQAFADGGKLPGDLSDLLELAQNDQLTDAKAIEAAKDVQKEANARNKTERGQRLLDALDTNGDGKVSDEEAMAGIAEVRRRDGGAGSNVAGIFDQLDTNGDGVVSPQEFQGITEIPGFGGPFVTAPVLTQMFRNFDGNGDGMISFAEAQMGADMFNQRFGRRGRRGEEGEQASERPIPQLAQMTQQLMVNLDRNKDGKISEAEAKRDKGTYDAFPMIDRDLDDHITAEEIYEYLKAQNPQLQQQQEERGGRPPFGRGRGRGR